MYTQGEREFATICTPITVSEAFELRFDEAYKIIQTPKNFSVSDPVGIDFSAQYEVQGNSIRGTRTLITSQSRHSCTKDQYAMRLKTLEEIAQHLKASILYKQ